MTYKRTIEIEGPHENAVQSFIHEMKKQADSGQRFGVNIEIRRVESTETEHAVEFETQ